MSLYEVGLDFGSVERQEWPFTDVLKELVCAERTFMEVLSEALEVHQDVEDVWVFFTRVKAYMWLHGY